MTTYIYVEKNGNATITISADDEGEATEYLRGTVKNPDNWRLDTEEDDLEEDDI